MEDTKEKLSDVKTELVKVNREITKLQAKRRLLERQRDELNEKIQKEECDELQNQNWGRKGFPWSDRLDAALIGVFQVEDYRPDQLAVINASLSKHDVILIMPTGGGKSLCYQLPALISEGVTLVITPLLALMEDQIMNLERVGVKACSLNAGTSKEVKAQVQTAMLDPNSDMKLLYVTPEKCSKSKQFMAKLQKMHQMGRFARLAIDEVHCCSQWGHDFRPDYKYLGAMRTMFPDVPILGLTATCTSAVTKDVKELLRIPSAMTFMSGFNRPNLHYSVRVKPESATECQDQLAELLTTEFRNQSGIIYTTTVKEVETLADALKAKGIRVGAYHAQMEPPERRSRVHKAWCRGDIQAVVATIAFGMGIDKPDVRFVIHHALSKSMENFYQESGRAGRDNKPAKCILFFRLADMFKQSTMVFTDQTGLEKLYNIVSYCVDQKQCRRSLIAEHFLETMEEVDCNEMCDRCEYTGSVVTKDVSDYGKAAVKILSQAKLKEIRLTGLKLVEALMGKGPNNVKLQGWKGSLAKEDTERVLINLILEGYIKEDFHYTAYSTISYLLPGHREVGKVEMDFVKGSPVKKAQKSNNSQRSENGSTSSTKSSLKLVEMDFGKESPGKNTKKFKFSKSSENGTSSSNSKPVKKEKRKERSDTEDSEDEIIEVKKRPKSGKAATSSEIIAVISDSDDDFVL